MHIPSEEGLNEHFNLNLIIVIIIIIIIFFVQICSSIIKTIVKQGISISKILVIYKKLFKYNTLNNAKTNCSSLIFYKKNIKRTSKICILKKKN